MMTDKELQDAIYEFNRRAKDRDSKLSRIREVLPPPGKILTVKEFVALIKNLHQILEPEK